MKCIGLYLNGRNGKLLALQDYLLGNIEAVQRLAKKRKADEFASDILIQYARAVVATDGIDYWEGIRRFPVDSIVADGINDKTGVSPPQKSMLDAAAIQDFVAARLSGREAEEVALVLGGHADGLSVGLAKADILFDLLNGDFVGTAVVGKIGQYLWKVAPDPTPDGLTPDELTAGFLAAQLGVPNGNPARLGVLGFDACQVANIEFATEMAPFAKGLVASQLNAPSAGWDYESWPGGVLSSGDHFDAMKAIVASFTTRNTGTTTADISAIDLDALEKCTKEFGKLSDMILEAPDLLDALANVREHSLVKFPLIESYLSFTRVDMGAFLQTFADALGHSSAAFAQVRAVLDALNAAVWDSWASVTAKNEKKLTGMSIAFPYSTGDFSDNFLTTYLAGGNFTRFKARTRWDEVLRLLMNRSIKK